MTLRPSTFWLTALAGIALCSGAHAERFGDTSTAISEASLAQVRGGFSSGGLSVSFGIKRAVFVNGTLVAATSLSGNAISAFSASNSGAVVQNSLDGQKIQSTTVINASANSLGLLRSMSLQSSLRAAVIDSLRR